jgi:hypothetical protein
MKASMWGARLMALPSISGCLGASDLRPSWGRHASSGPARLLAAMQDIWVSLHSIRSRLNITVLRFIVDNLFMRHTFQDPVGYPRILDIIDLRPLWSRHAYKASSSSALSDSLQPCLEIWVSLHFVRSRLWLSFLLFFEHQTSRVACFNVRGLLYECVSDALLFSSSYRHVRKPVAHHVVTRPIFLSFLNHHTGHPAHHDAWILLYECILDALWIFSSSFRSIGSLLLIGSHLISLRSARIQTGRLLSRFVLFLF